MYIYKTLKDFKDDMYKQKERGAKLQWKLQMYV